MNIAQYLDSTYLKTSQQAGITESDTLKKVKELADEAIQNHFFAIMIRPEYVKEMKHYLQSKNSTVKLGTVIGFHEGTANTEFKMQEARKAIEDGADELDFVINYDAYKRGEEDLVKNEFIECTTLALKSGKIVKWIIETAALANQQIADITKHISEWATESFAQNELANIFVKSSTGFYITKNGKPNGATFEVIRIMLENAGKLSVKASGGVKTPEDARKMIEMGVKRIGTSSALALIQNLNIKGY